MEPRKELPGFSGLTTTYTRPGKAKYTINDLHVVTSSPRAIGLGQE